MARRILFAAAMVAGLLVAGVVSLGAQPQLMKVSPVGRPDVVGWEELFHLSSAPAPALTYAEVAGTVDSRFVLTEDGNIRWIYENDYLEYPYVIRGNRIYDAATEVGAQTRNTYVYDPATRNILSFNTVYYRKK